MKKFICQKNGSNYYLVNNGMGGFLNPPNHPEHFYSIVECRGGHEIGCMPLSYVSECDYLPPQVRGTAKGVLKRFKAGIPDEKWLGDVYNYFRHCYSKDGINQNVNDCIIYGRFWDNAHLESEANPYHHLGYLFVRKFYPDHQPDLKRIAVNDPLGAWSTD